MRRTLILLLLSQAWSFAFSQAPGSTGQVAARIEALKARGVQFTPVQLVKQAPDDAKYKALWQAACTRATVVHMNKATVDQLLRKMPGTMEVTLPTPDGPVTLELEQWQPLADGFTVKSASKGTVEVAPGAHYRGRVKGDNRSVAGLSVFGDALMAMVRTARGTLVLGRLKQAAEGVHVAYWDQDLRPRNPFTCATVDNGELPHPEDLHGEPGDRTIRCVKLYWEVNYNIFQDKGSVTATTNYVTGLFNQSAIIYDNDGVDVQLQEVFVWDTASPYTGPDSGDFLDQFGAYRTSFNGDLAHLIGYGGGGGVAWLNTLCSGAQYRMAYSGINGSYSNVPTYSWSVEVVTHEQGHNMGSPHTHACYWNGNGTAIDGCGPTAGYSEGSCPVAPLPPNGGTIMSYCHLVGGVGINFNYGFGPQPAALIRNRVNAATCLDQCGSTCDSPGNLSVYPLTATSATLHWADLGIPSYNLRWKPQPSGTWNNVLGLTATSYPLTGLTQNTSYEFQVQSNCTVGSSGFSDTLVFTTPIPCPDTLEANNTFATAAPLVLPASISALVATAGDADYYSFSIPAISNLNISLSNPPADFDLKLLDGTGAQVAISQNGGTNGEYINYPNAAAGNYVVHVYGYAGANSPVSCYSLYASAYEVFCPKPQSQSATNITYNSATLNWTAVQSAMQYDVQWKESGAATWNLVTNITGTTYVLNGLDWATEHLFRVRSVCEGEGGTTQFPTSEWTDSTAFTTLDPPCEVAPPTVLAAKVLLDGAWRSADNLMMDSLRAAGLLPLTEPYTAQGHTITGATTTTAAVLSVTGNNAIVDWVLVELRSTTTPSQILESHAALVQRDGDIVAVDGTSPVGFCQIAGSYHVAVRHRNHLGVMTAQPIALGATATALNLSIPGTATWGTNARKLANGRAMLWSGNVVDDAQVKYTGTNNDRDPILTAIGSSVATNTISGYHVADVTLDGTVKYTGAGNDRDPILNNIGDGSPTGVVMEQLP